MNKDRLIKELELLNIIVTEEMLSNLDIFCNYLIKENEKTNLTALKEIPDIYLKHIYDSLTLTKAVDLSRVDTLLDIGSGAGFPGIVLKIFYPNLNITLIEANSKKAIFLSNVIKLLELKGITVINKRAEEYVSSARENFDIVTARAVKNLRILIELSIPYVRVNGVFIAMKGSIEEELEAAQKIVKLLGIEKIEIISFKLPIEDSKRNLVVMKKKKKTPAIYPRAYSRIIKNY